MDDINCINCGIEFGLFAFGTDGKLRHIGPCCTFGVAGNKEQDKLIISATKEWKGTKLIIMSHDKEINELLTSYNKELQLK